MKTWTVYLLKCRDDTFYCGITNDIQKRLKAHNTGKGAKYTRGRGPVVLKAWLGNLTHSEALKIEHAVKKLPKDLKWKFFR